MAQNVQIAGASYTDVPSISIPKVGGGTASFYDVQGSQNITENGSYDVTTKASVNVNVQGSTETPLNVTANGTYTAPSGQAYNPVTVAVPSQTYYTGSAEPSSSLGNDGDLYFKEA